MARQGSDQENRDQRAKMVTEDPNSMTIDFLRARLLAERAVSKSAREKADELAQRVAELEEQLRIVSLLRKKAEKATSDVLAILEEHGFTDVSETFDSSSDHESLYEINVGKSSISVEEGSVDSKVRSNEMEELSASENGSLSVPRKTISWKGRRSEPRSSDKLKEPRTSRQRSFSTPRPRQGKSCRQIRRREPRSIDEDHKRDRNTVVFEESEVNKSAIHPKATEEVPKTFTICADVEKDKDLQNLPKSNSLEDQNNTNINMERALERHAQLIGRFEDMERAQREWEEKFRESNIATMDLYDPGSHSDVTDESNDSKIQAQHQGATEVSVHGARPKNNAVDFAESFETRSHVLPGNSETSQGNQFPSCVSKPVDEDVSLPGGTGKYIQGRLESGCSRPQSSNSDSHGHSLADSLSHLVSQPNSGSSSYCNGVTSIQKGAYPLVPVVQENSNGCSTVLTALKQARLSLQAKINSLPPPKAGCASEGPHLLLPASRRNTCALTEPALVTKPSIYASSVGRMAEVPVGCAGLFRVPSDFSSDVSKRSNFLALPPQITSTSHLPEAEIPLFSGNEFFSTISTTNPLSPRLQSHLASIATCVKSGDRPLTTPYIGGSKLWPSFRTDDPLIDGFQVFSPYTSIPSASDCPISSEISACVGDIAPPISLRFDRLPNSYAGNLSIHPSSTSSLPSNRSQMQHGMERFSTSIGMLPVDRLASDNFRCNIYK